MCIQSYLTMTYHPTVLGWPKQPPIPASGDSLNAQAYRLPRQRSWHLLQADQHTGLHRFRNSHYYSPEECRFYGRVHGHVGESFIIMLENYRDKIFLTRSISRNSDLMMVALHLSRTMKSWGSYSLYSLLARSREHLLLDHSDPPLKLRRWRR